MEKKNKSTRSHIKHVSKGIHKIIYQQRLRSISHYEFRVWASAAACGCLRLHPSPPPSRRQIFSQVCAPPHDDGPTALEV